MTGAQEALPDTGPQPGSATAPPGAAPAAYPEQWYDSPRLDDRARTIGHRVTRARRARPTRGWPA